MISLRRSNCIDEKFNCTPCKDVTKRYVANFMTSTRKIRFDDTWIHTTVSKFNKHLGEKVRTELC